MTNKNKNRDTYGEKARAAFLALIMITSVMVGTVALSGGAAAAPQDETSAGALANGEAVAFADPANPNALNANHTIVAVAGSGGFTPKNITIKYQSSVTTTTVDQDDVNAFVGGTEVTVDGFSEDNANNRITAEFSGFSTPINTGDRFILDVGDIDNPSGDVGVSVNITSKAGQGASDGFKVSGANEPTITISNSASDFPITANPGSTSNTIFFNSLDEALGNVSGSSSSITVTEDLNETSVASTLNDTGSRPLANGDVVIQGQDNPTINVSQAPAIDLNGADNVNINGLTFNATGSSPPNAAIQTSSGASNELTIDDNEFRNFTTGPVIDSTTNSNDIEGNITDNLFDQSFGTNTEYIDVHDTDNGPTNPFLNITGNNFNASLGSDAINFATATDPTRIESNTITNLTTGTGIDINSGDETILSGNIIEGTNQQGTAIEVDTTGPNLVDIDDETISDTNNGIVLEGAAPAVVTNIDVSNIGTNGVDIDTPNGDVTINESTSVNNNDQSGTGVRVDLTSANTATLDGISINGTSTGVDVANYGNPNAQTIISDAEITQSGTQGVDFNNPGEGNLAINESSLIESTLSGVNTGIRANLGSGEDLTVNTTDINGTTTGINIAGATDDSARANITLNTITNTQGGINVTGGTNGPAAINISLNTIDSNSEGVVFNDGSISNTVNLTFNDITNSENTALNVKNFGSSGRINANYTHFGDSTGPNGSDTVPGAHGDGGRVVVNTGNVNPTQVDVFPFLEESISQFGSDARNGNEFVVLPDPTRPIEGTTNRQVAGVTVLDFGESQATASNVTLTGGNVDQRILGSTSDAQLGPNTVDRFNLSSDVNAGTVDVTAVSRSDAIGDGSLTQTVTGQFNASTSTITDDNNQLRSGQTVNFTVQLNDDAGNAHEHQGVEVDFTSQNFGSAGVQFTRTEGNTSNEGTATATIAANGLQPGEDFTVRAFVGPDEDLFEQTLTTATGAIDAESSRLLLNDQASDPAAQQVDSTLDIAAQINDSQDNPLSDETVEFSSNASGVSFGDTSVQTDNDGFANTTVTLPTDVTTVALNASAGDFSADTTGSAQINVSTKAGDATQLGFASDTRSMAPGASLNPTVQIQDEFGNFNNTANVNNEISVTSSDTNVISVSGVDDLDAEGSNNADSFTLSADSGGEATITVSSDDSDISGVNDTFVVSDPAAIDLSVAHNVATVSANNSNANTQNQALMTAQFTDSDGSALGVANENISFGLSGSSAELNQSDVTTKSTDGDGNVTILVNGTDTTGTSTIVATAENFTSINRGETTVTTTGSASGISLSPENDTIAQNDEINVTAEFVDDEGRNVPRLTDVSLSADDGNVTTGTTATAPNDDGAVVSTFTYNSSGASESVTITATGGGLFGETTVTIEEQSQSPLDGPAGRFDNNGDGDITVSELGDAGTAFAQGELTVSELGEVGEAFAS